MVSTVLHLVLLTDFTNAVAEALKPRPSLTASNSIITTLLAPAVGLQDKPSFARTEVDLAENVLNEGCHCELCRL